MTTTATLTKAEVLAVDCSQCGAPAGTACQTKTGNVATTPHAKRLAAADPCTCDGQGNCDHCATKDLADPCTCGGQGFCDHCDSRFACEYCGEDYTDAELVDGLCAHCRTPEPQAPAPAADAPAANVDPAADEQLGSVKVPGVRKRVVAKRSDLGPVFVLQDGTWEPATKAVAATFRHKAKNAHADCTHPRTHEGRVACRKARREAARKEA